MSDDFHKSLGIQNYKLLAYLSSLLNNVSIIEIVTHDGESKVVLSWNKSIEIIRSILNIYGDTNKKFKDEYISNKHFYDSQFKFVDYN